jgi:deazaflavin-dependent oxidoreductase (nitroreductase family)
MSASTSEPSFIRPPAGPVQRLVLRSLALVYRGPVAELFSGRCVMLLTTRGRRSGRWRTTGVSFMPVDDHFVIFSGWGVGSNWYRNLRANPEVILTVGRRRLRARAQVVAEPERRRALMLQMQARAGRCGPPKPLRPIGKLTGMLDYDAEIALAVAAGGTLPVIELFPA